MYIDFIILCPYDMMLLMINTLSRLNPIHSSPSAGFWRLNENQSQSQNKIRRGNKYSNCLPLVNKHQTIITRATRHIKGTRVHRSRYATVRSASIRPRRCKVSNILFKIFVSLCCLDGILYFLNQLYLHIYPDPS